MRRRSTASASGVPCLAEQPQRLLDTVGYAHPFGQLANRCGRLALAVTERDERVHDIRRGGRRAVDAHRLRDLRRELVLELEEQALRSLLADARHARQPARLLLGDRLRELAHRESRQHRERDLRADAVHLEKLAERAALTLGAEAEQQMRVLAHDEMREQRHALAVLRKVVERAHRHVHFIRDALHVEQELRGILFEQRAREAANHGRPFYAGSKQKAPFGSEQKVGGTAGTCRRS